MDTFKTVVPEAENVSYCASPYETLEDADALIVLTEWDEFRQADLAKVKSMLKLPIIIDGRNLYEPKEMKEQGFEYYCMGR